jgi:hypothetical protein
MTPALTATTEVFIPLVGFAVGVALALAVPPLLAWIGKRRAIRLRVSRLPDVEPSPAPASGPDPTSQEHLDTALTNIAREPIGGPRFYVAGIEVKDFRCFERSSIDLHYPGEGASLKYANVNLILGDNGAGKSTLLKAIALAALGPVLDSSGFVPYRLVRTGGTDQTGHRRASVAAQFVSDRPDLGPRHLEGRVGIELRGDYEQVSAERSGDEWSSLFEESDPSFFVVGYGVNRRVAADDTDLTTLERSRRRRRYQRVASLFDESAVLTPLSSWLPGVNRRRRSEITDLLLALVPADTNLSEGWQQEPVFVHRGVEVPYRALSDGYKSFIGWVGDLLFQIHSVTQGELPYTEVGGIVLVDEVDLLLHPSWQREVVPNISQALPNLQFVFTSHSPIVAGTLTSENIIVARENSDGTSRLQRVHASIHGLNAEQILLSSYFELESTRAPGKQSELYRLAQRAMAGDDRAAVEYLEVLAAKPPKADEER